MSPSHARLTSATVSRVSRPSVSVRRPLTCANAALAPVSHRFSLTLQRTRACRRSSEHERTQKLRNLGTCLNPRETCPDLHKHPSVSPVDNSRTLAAQPNSPVSRPPYYVGVCQVRHAPQGDVGPGRHETASRTTPHPMKGTPMNTPQEDPNTTSTGTKITVEDSAVGRLVICDNPAAPDDMRHCEVGRIVDGGFQPAPLSAWGLRPEALRIIADLVEAEAQR